MPKETYNLNRIKHRIKRTKDKIKEYETNKENLSSAGFWSYGYHQGVLSELENTLDSLEENKKEDVKMKIEITVFKKSGKWYTSDIIESPENIMLSDDKFKDFIRKHNPANIGEGYIVVKNVDNGECTGFHNVLWTYDELYKA